MGPAYSSSRLPLGEATAHWLSASHLDRLATVIRGLFGVCHPWTCATKGKWLGFPRTVSRSGDRVNIWRSRWSAGTPWSKAGLADYSRGKCSSSDGFCVAKSRIFKGIASVTLQSSRHIGYFVARQKKIKEWKWSIARHTYQRSGISTSGRRPPPPFPRWRLWVGSGVSVQIVPRWRPGAAGWRSRNCRDRPGRVVPAGWGREAGWQEPDIVARSWGLAPPRPLRPQRTLAEPTAWGDPGVTLAAAAVVVVVAAAQTLCPLPRPGTLHPAFPRISVRDPVREVEAEKWWCQRRCAASALTCFIAICTDTNLREHPGLQMIPSEYLVLCCFAACQSSSGSRLMRCPLLVYPWILLKFWGHRLSLRHRLLLLMNLKRKADVHRLIWPSWNLGLVYTGPQTHKLEISATVNDSVLCQYCIDRSVTYSATFRLLFGTWGQ